MRYFWAFEIAIVTLTGLITLLTVRRWLFWLIQVVSANLFIPGLIVSIVAPWHLVDGKGHWNWRVAWVFDNQEDGIFGPGPQTRGQAIKWAGWRNFVNNLRYVHGVSKKGRPLWRKTWGPKPGGLYFQSGWNSSGYPVLSGGRNVNPY